MTDITMTFNAVPIQSKRIVSQTMEGSNVFEITFACVTTSYSQITALSALKGSVTKTRCIGGKMSVQTTGTKATLSVNSTSYTNCVIDSLTVNEEPDTRLGIWNYTISFARDTVST